VDIETLPLEGYRHRVSLKLKRNLRLGKMDAEQQERYLTDPAAEEERVYRLGSLSAASGRVLCIGVHVGPAAGLAMEGPIDKGTEHAFGIDAQGRELGEKQALTEFIALASDFKAETDEVVGHNIISFDLPFIYQRCLVNGLTAPTVTRASERNIFDTMHRWWLGARRTVSLDDIAWALGIESSKTEEEEGSRVFDLYRANRLLDIREYNLKDVRVTRAVYERMVASCGI
jgi:DNA polymerase elongation subunit (family B)